MSYRELGPLVRPLVCGQAAPAMGLGCCRIRDINRCLYPHVKEFKGLSGDFSPLGCRDVAEAGAEFPHLCLLSWDVGGCNSGYLRLFQ